MAEAAGFRIVRKDDGVYVDGVRILSEQQNTVADTTAVANSNNVGDLPETVNAIIDALIAHGLIADNA